jgi:hypothetical protein
VATMMKVDGPFEKTDDIGTTDDEVSFRLPFVDNPHFSNSSRSSLTLSFRMRDSCIGARFLTTTAPKYSLNFEFLAAKKVFFS